MNTPTGTLDWQRTSSLSLKQPIQLSLVLPKAQFEIVPDLADTVCLIIVHFWSKINCAHEASSVSANRFKLKSFPGVSIKPDMSAQEKTIL